MPKWDKKSRQEAYSKNNDTCKDSTFFCAGSTVAVHGEDGSPWMHDITVEGNSDDLQRQSCQVPVTKMSRVIT